MKSIEEITKYFKNNYREVLVPEDKNDSKYYALDNLMIEVWKLRDEILLAPGFPRFQATLNGTKIIKIKDSYKDIFDKTVSILECLKEDNLGTNKDVTETLKLLYLIFKQLEVFKYEDSRAALKVRNGLDEYFHYLKILDNLVSKYTFTKEQNLLLSTMLCDILEDYTDYVYREYITDIDEKEEFLQYPCGEEDVIIKMAKCEGADIEKIIKAYGKRTDYDVGDPYYKDYQLSTYNSYTNFIEVMLNLSKINQEYEKICLDYIEELLYSNINNPLNRLYVISKTKNKEENMKFFNENFNFALKESLQKEFPVKMELPYNTYINIEKEDISKIVLEYLNLQNAHINHELLTQLISKQR